MSAAGSVERSGCDARLERIAAEAGALARLGGIEFVLSLRLGDSAPFDATGVGAALHVLLANALTQTPRGGRIALVGAADATGIRLELSTAAPEEFRGLPDARRLVELGCGAATARAVRRARALLAKDRARLAYEPGDRERVTIHLAVERTPVAA